MSFITDLFRPSIKWEPEQGLAKGMDERLYSQALSGAVGGLADTDLQQQQFIDQIRAMSLGQGPSVAEEMLKAQTDQGIQQQAGMLASARGLNPALAARLAAQGGAQARQAMNQQAGLMRAQEALGAAGMLGSAIGQRQQGQLGTAQTVGGQMLSSKQQADQLRGSLEQTAMGGGSDIGKGFVGGLFGGVGGAGAKLAGFYSGGKVPRMYAGGEAPTQDINAPVNADHPANDTVPAMLSPGEVVLPRSVADNPEKAAAFVRELKKKSKPTFQDVIDAQAGLENRLSAIEEFMSMQSGGQEVGNE